jgi:hypothetical protein
MCGQSLAKPLDIERDSLVMPALIGAALVQMSIADFTQSGMGIVRMWAALPTRSAITQ